MITDAEKLREDFKQICWEMDSMYSTEQMTPQDFYYLLGVADSIQNGDRMKLALKSLSHTIFNLSDRYIEFRQKAWENERVSS